MSIEKQDQKNRKKIKRLSKHDPEYKLAMKLLKNKKVLKVLGDCIYVVAVEYTKYGHKGDLLLSNKKRNTYFVIELKTIRKSVRKNDQRLKRRKVEFQAYKYGDFVKNRHKDAIIYALAVVGYFPQLEPEILKSYAFI